MWTSHNWYIETQRIQSFWFLHTSTKQTVFLFLKTLHKYDCHSFKQNLYNSISIVWSLFGCCIFTQRCYHTFLFSLQVSSWPNSDVASRIISVVNGFLVSKETMVPRQWESETKILGFSNELIKVEPPRLPDLESWCFEHQPFRAKDWCHYTDEGPTLETPAL